jgi:hypothetical protein
MEAARPEQTTVLRSGSLAMQTLSSQEEERFSRFRKSIGVHAIGSIGYYQCRARTWNGVSLLSRPNIGNDVPRVERDNCPVCCRLTGSGLPKRRGSETAAATQDILGNL